MIEPTNIEISILRKRTINSMIGFIMPSDTTSPGLEMRMSEGGNDPPNHWVRSWNFDLTHFLYATWMTWFLVHSFRNGFDHRQE